jgi:predicted AAA+ superfamily ATPase
LIATGSSQLEIQDCVAGYLTGRQITATILPFSYQERPQKNSWEEYSIYGGYPQVVLSAQPLLLLQQLYRDYVSKDIVEILRIPQPEVLEQLLTLLAHSSGQLVNYNQLSQDCRTTYHTLTSYLNILEKTFVVNAITPFVGNKRTEITSNPIYYFIDNGFRNQALNNFSPLETRVDKGLLIENLVFSELLKLKYQKRLTFDIHFWRTKGGAEVDFVLTRGIKQAIPVEVKYQILAKPAITRGFRSFIDAYQPEDAFVVSKNQLGQLKINRTTVHFIPFPRLELLFADLIGLLK